MGLYRSVLRPVLFRTDAERMHGIAIRAAQVAGSSSRLCASVAARHMPMSARLGLRCAGLEFATPLGLAAGFDKSARAVRFLSTLGFGHVEVGSISADPSAGNPGTRLFRIPQDRGIVVHYGLPNDGADAVAQRLHGVRLPVPLGINIVSTNRGPGAKPDPDDVVIDDYLRSVHRLQPHADYLCLNLSCPNTRDGRNFFHEPRRLRVLLDELDALGIDKPLFLKVAPFADTADVESFLEAVAHARFVDGFAVNLPPDKPAGLSTTPERLARMPGAVSGAPAAAAADRTIAELYRRMNRERYRIIGSGGVFTGDDAYRKIRLGATLVQLLTALVYEGPEVVASINARLAQLLEADGFEHVADAVGIDAPSAQRVAALA
jgi:dihydroorotate dehydrogenase